MNAVAGAVTRACLGFAKLVRARAERSLSKIAHCEAARTPLARLRPHGRVEVGRRERRHSAGGVVHRMMVDVWSAWGEGLHARQRLGIEVDIEALLLHR